MLNLENQKKKERLIRILRKRLVFAYNRIIFFYLDPFVSLVVCSRKHPLLPVDPKNGYNSIDLFNIPQIVWN